MRFFLLSLVLLPTKAGASEIVAFRQPWYDFKEYCGLAQTDFQKLERRIAKRNDLQRYESDDGSLSSINFNMFGGSFTVTTEDLGGTKFISCEFLSKQNHEFDANNLAQQLSIEHSITTEEWEDAKYSVTIEEPWQKLETQIQLRIFDWGYQLYAEAVERLR